MSKQALTLPNGDVITYRLERRKRRTIGLKITDEGLIVHAPQRIAEAQLQVVLSQKAKWVMDKLHVRKQHEVPPIAWADGELIYLYGNPLELRLDAQSRHRQPELSGETLVVSINTQTSSAEAIRTKVLQWYKKQALPDFSRRLAVFAAKLGVATPPLSLSSAQSRWGSCSSRGNIRLNWRLLQAPPHIINYVICHELAHLKEMNHSARFWAVVEGLFPEYKQAEKELKALSPLLHRL
jgi:predicted metal-dependent hydrolase